MNFSLKHLAKQITPPVIWDAVRKGLVKPERPFTYEGRFDSFDSAYHKYPEATNYHSGVSEAAEYESAKTKLEAFNKGDDPQDAAHLTRLNFLPTLLSLYDKEIISILDVGGGLGTSFIDLKYCIPEKSISMTVLELPNVAKSGAKLFEGHKDIQFVDKMPLGKDRFDLVHFGSSLQYCQNYQDTIKKAASLNPQIIAISYTAMGPALTFVAVQLNMPGRVIPRLVFNKKELLKMLEDEGYMLIHQSVYFRDGISFVNYASPINETRHWNIVFRRKTAEEQNEAIKKI